MNSIGVAVRIVVALLVAGQYKVAAAMTRGDRLSAEELEQAVARYGRTLAPVPDAEFDALDVVAIEGRPAPTFHAIIDLWTVEEGRSDLSLELELTERYEEVFEVRILDLHVM